MEIRTLYKLSTCWSFMESLQNKWCCVACQYWANTVGRLHCCPPLCLWSWTEPGAQTRERKSLTGPASRLSWLIIAGAAQLARASRLCLAAVRPTHPLLQGGVWRQAIRQTVLDPPEFALCDAPSVSSLGGVSSRAAVSYSAKFAPFTCTAKIRRFSFGGKLILTSNPYGFFVVLSGTAAASAL